MAGRGCYDFDSYEDRINSYVCPFKADDLGYFDQGSNFITCGDGWFTEDLEEINRSELETKKGKREARDNFIGNLPFSLVTSIKALRAALITRKKRGTCKQENKVPFRTKGMPLTTWQLSITHRPAGRYLKAQQLIDQETKAGRARIKREQLKKEKWERAVRTEKRIRERREREANISLEELIIRHERHKKRRE